jgi:hypothetical protein
MVGVGGDGGGHTCELGRDGFAQDDRARTAKQGDHAGVYFGLVVFENTRTHLGGLVMGVDHILDADGDAMQGTQDRR